MSDTTLTLVHTVQELRAQVSEWRGRGLRCAFVPTMGNLHRGHISLIDKAHQHADRVIASVFVNPLQFGPDEDYQVYPRTLDVDGAMLGRAGVRLLFAPSVKEMYPHGEHSATRVVVPDLSDVLCGKHRPGHFGGMATVVCKLLNMVKADVAIFGEKDYQQLMIVRRLVEDLWIPTEIVGAPTFREQDGLAMSSRNRYLTPTQRAAAPTLYAVMSRMIEQITQGQSVKQSREEGLAALIDAGFDPNYLSVRRARTLERPSSDDQALVLLAAAWLGKARLIDNIPFALAQPLGPRANEVEG